MQTRQKRTIIFLEIVAQDFSYSLRLLQRKTETRRDCHPIASRRHDVKRPGPECRQRRTPASAICQIPAGITNGLHLHARRGIRRCLYPDYKYYRDHNRSFSGLAAFPNSISKIRFGQRRREEMGTTEQVSDNYFQVMGIQPFLGRLFSPGEDEQHAAEVVLTYSCWKRWGADPHIVGETVTVGTTPFTIAGVAPKSFTGTVFGFNADAMMNLGLAAAPDQPQTATDRDNRWLVLVGRLKPGVTAKLAGADMRVLSAQLAADFPAPNKDRVAKLTDTTVLPPDARSIGKLISGVLVVVVLLVLLIACANVANLLLGLATGRKQEILIRSALGATRGRLIRQLLTESLVLSTAGGAIGFALASAVAARLSHFRTTLPVFGAFDFATNFQTGGTVVAMTVAIILLASLATGLAPALYASEPNVAGALSGEAVVGGTRKSLTRNALVVVQIAVCTLVIAGVGLFLRSLYNLRQVEIGFSSHHLLAALINFGADGFSQAEAEALYQRLDQSATQMYGVESHTLAVDVPLMNDNWPTSEIAIRGANDAEHQHEQIPGTVVDPNYFQTLGIPVLAGRAFTAADTNDRPQVLIINRTMAQTYWPSQDAVEKKCACRRTAATLPWSVLLRTASTTLWMKPHTRSFITRSARITSRVWF